MYAQEIVMIIELGKATAKTKGCVVGGVTDGTSGKKQLFYKSSINDYEKTQADPAYVLVTTGDLCCDTGTPANCPGL